MKILNFIICDDIRMEAGNKNSLMGVYSDSINFHFQTEGQKKWPQTKRLAIYTQLEADKENLLKIKSFKLQINYNGEIITIGGNDIPPPTDLKGQKGFILNALFNNFKFIAPGGIKFTFQFYDKENNMISEISPPFSLKVEETIG